MEKDIRKIIEKAAARIQGSGSSESGPSPCWFDRHFHWRSFLRDQVLGRSTFKHRSHWDYLGYTGTMALVLFAIQAATGIFLLFYYVPDPDKAFGSVQMIRNDVPFGMVYQSIHSVSAKLLILVLFIHMCRIMIISAYRGPREPQWYTGATLLFLMLFAGFSGYLLPWTQQSYWASVIGTEALRSIPLLGDFLVSLLRGGENVSGATLHRFFAFHVTLLPICVIILMWIHIKRVWKAGVIAPPDMRALVVEDDCISCGKCEAACTFDAIRMTPRQGRELPLVSKDDCNGCRACVDICPEECITFVSDRREFLTEPIVPDNLINRLKGVMIGLMVLSFSVFFLHGALTAERVPADPLLTPDWIKPDWYFLAAYQALRQLPSQSLGLLAIAAASLLIFFLPAVDKKGPREFERRPVYLFLVISGIISFVVLTIMGLIG